MAIVRLGTVVAAISGSIGGTTFAHTKGGTVARAKLRQTKKTGFRNLQVRNDMSRQRGIWRGLTTIQRQAWTVAALQLPRANRLGQRNVMSGYQLFIRTNMFARRGPASPFTNMPDFTDVPDMTNKVPVETFDVVFSIANGYFYSAVPRILTTFLTVAAIYGGRTFRDYPTGIVPPLRMFFQGVDLFTPQDITAPWNLHVGEPSVGEFVFVRFVWSGNTIGSFNLPLDFRVQVTA